MLPQGHVGATLYPYPGQVGPIFGKSGSLEEWEWCHNVIVEADFHLSLLQTSILDIYKVFAPLVCCLKGVWVHPYTVTPTKLALDLGILGSFEEWQWCLKIMFGADIYLKPLHTSISDIYKVFYLLLCCLKGMWVHPYIVTPAKLAPDFGIQVHLWSENDAITSWFRLIFPSDHSIHPY